MDKNPMSMFRAWLQEAIDNEVLEANAFILATVDRHGRPASRAMLLKEIDDGGFIFYTNYESRKAKELGENPWSSLTFLWKELERQVIIEGGVEKISEEHSAKYFASRPRETQIGAWTSHQGKVIASRADLDETYELVKQRFEGMGVPKPPYWGGYRIVPELWLFWHGRENRLHDRFMYTLDGEGGWRIQRISP